jgi:hypothetical protein
MIHVLVTSKDDFSNVRKVAPSGTDFLYFAREYLGGFLPCFEAQPSLLLVFFDNRLTSSAHPQFWMLQMESRKESVVVWAFA